MAPKKAAPKKTIEKKTTKKKSYTADANNDGGANIILEQKTSSMRHNKLPKPTQYMHTPRDSQEYDALRSESGQHHHLAHRP